MGYFTMYFCLLVFVYLGKYLPLCSWHHLDSHRASQIALVVKKKKKKSASKSRRHKRHWFDPWARKMPWRREWQPTLVSLPGKFHGERSLVAYSPWVCRVGHNWVNKYTYTHTHAHKWPPQTLKISNHETHN